MKVSQFQKQVKVTSELIEAFMFYYGGSKKNAILQLASYTDNAKTYLLDGYREQLKRAFYED